MANKRQKSFSVKTSKTLFGQIFLLATFFFLPVLSSHSQSSPERISGSRYLADLDLETKRSATEGFFSKLSEKTKIVTVADFNADSYCDLLLQKHDTSLTIALNDREGGFKFQATSLIPTTSNTFAAYVDSNQQADLVIKENHSSQIEIHLNPISNISKDKFTVKLASQYKDALLKDVWSAKDERNFNILLETQKGHKATLLKFNDSAKILSTSEINNAAHSPWLQIRLADLDSDGEVDILSEPFYYPFTSKHPVLKNRMRWGAALSSKASVFKDWTPWADFTSALSLNLATIANIDGTKNDLVVAGNNNRHLWTAISNGEIGIESSLPAKLIKAKWDKIFSCDFNSDSIDDILLRDSESNKWNIYSFKANKKRPSKTKGPYVCIGYTPASHSLTKWGRLHGLSCPRDYALVEIDDASSSASKANNIMVMGLCCPLPSKDILIEEIIFAKSICPNNHVATGRKQSTNDPQEIMLECTKINTQRYQLGTYSKSLYWGIGESSWGEPNTVHKEEIPIAIRHGVGRQTYLRWDTDGCISKPWGSLLVEKRLANSCSSFRFRPLEYRGLKGDPPQGTRVKMFPNCRKIQNVFNASSGCFLQ